MGRPSLITEEMEDFIRGELIKAPRPTADTIYQHLVKALEGKKRRVPGEDAIIKRITKLRKEVEEHPVSALDRPWTVGACIYADIPAEIIPLLIAEQRRSLKTKAARLKDADQWDITVSGKKLSKVQRQTFAENLADRALLTVRQARWVAMLYPTITTLNPASKDTLQLANGIIVKAKLYAYREQIAELKELRFPDTSDIDSTIDDVSPDALGWDILDYNGVLDNMSQEWIDGIKSLLQEGKK